jgi:putative transcriptional regulator
MGVELINTLKENRLNANLTQEELADKIGVTRQTIISIEKGVYAPSVTLALLLSKILKKQVEDTFSIKSSIKK